MQIRTKNEGSMQFGFDVQSDWPWPADVPLHDCCRPQGEPLTDVASATRSALQQPIQFPSLNQAVVPGDHITLAVDAAVPHAATVVAEVLSTLHQAQVPLDTITVLLSASDPKVTHELIQSTANQRVGEGVQWLIHNPADEGSLSYLAASKAGDPIYFHRQLAEADLVIPIGVLRPDRAPGYVGICGSLFPNFADQKTQDRFRSGYRKKWRAHQTTWREEVEEATWLLGVQFTVQVVPGPGDSILGVLAGELSAVRDQGKAWMKKAWRWEFSESVPLVVASLEGNPQQQTWSNLAAALSHAATIVERGGAIAICTRLNESPGEAMQSLALEDDERPLRGRKKQRVPEDLVAAVIVREVRRQRRIFLMSDLSSDLVEELGLGYIESPHELMNLVQRSKQAVVVGNAHFASLHLTGE